jgi:hypothetical protein
MSFKFNSFLTSKYNRSILPSQVTERVVLDSYLDEKTLRRELAEDVDPLSLDNSG